MPKQGTAAKQQLNLNLLYPALFQAFQANIAMGKDPMEFLKQFSVDKPKGKQKAGLINVGGSWIDVSALSAGLPALLQEQQAAQAGQFQKSYDTLSQVPALSQLFADAKGDFAPQFTADVNTAYESMGSSLLGQGAKSGFLADPNKQASILGPLALDKQMFLTNMQKAAQAQAMGLAGGGGLQGSGAVGNLGAGQPGSYGAGIFNVAGMQQNAYQFDQQMGFQEKMAGNSMYMDMAGMGLGAALGFGGFLGG